jgi:tRNA U54 and U55 pseudouridine synthase Pus10
MKFGRDVPQAAWVIDNERKGRNSIEEIVTDQVRHVLQASQCFMHSCGREDIDVRCLGEVQYIILCFLKFHQYIKSLVF